jgi:hypothetical protein
MVASRREVIPAKGDDWMLHFMVMEVRPEQKENASFPMVVTLEGMVTEVRLEQP